MTHEETLRKALEENERECRLEVVGMKFDNDKLRFDLIPPQIMEELAKVLTFGANKYADNSWQAIEKKRYIAALHRHINLYQQNERYDQESGMSHLSHALCNIAFLLYKELNNEK